MIDSFRGRNRFLSNFHPASVELDGVTYPTTEHAYQAAKSLDPYYRERILQCDTPGDAKRLASQIKPREDWDQIKQQVMWDLLCQKFTLETVSGELLLRTDPEELVEGNSWHDIYWGVCWGHCRVGHPGHPMGDNILGKLLMQRRDELRFESSLQVPPPDQKKKVLITGSQNWKSREIIQNALQRFDPANTVIIHGAAPGADSIADEIARAAGFEVIAFPADWSRQGKAAGVIRNQEMVDLFPDECLAFPHKDSKGTNDCVHRAAERLIPVEVHWEEK